jgi:hypothetical protein
MNTTTSRGRVLGALLATSLVAACDFISPTETDPNAVPQATVDQLFTSIQVNSFFFAEGQISRIASLWMQQMEGTDRQFQSLSGYIFNEESADGEFSTIYTGGGLIDLAEAIALAEAADRRVYAGILKVHEAFLFGMAASIFGDIPYSEAASEGIDAPALDDQAAVYAAVQARLDEAIADLGSGQGTGPGGADLNFGGDAARWTAVAHTLKARFHLHWGEANGDAAYQSALSEAEQGIATAAGSWKAVHSSAATEQNLWYQFMRDRSGYISSGDHLLPMMVADDDPRLPLYFSSVSGGGFVPRQSVLSETGYGAPDFDFPMVTCAETAFIRAEAHARLGDEGAARAAARDGLACQEAEWGVDLAVQGAALDAATGGALLDAIMSQKYAALFLNMEVWNDYKRTCLPAIAERSGGMPGRLYYGQAERQSNPNIPAPAQQPLRNDNDPEPC